MKKSILPVYIMVILAVSICSCHPKSVQDYDGNVYGVVKIGNQLWMAENLKVTHYADGTNIPLVEDVSEWKNLGVDAKAYCYYKNDSSLGNVYGALYTWDAATNGFPGGGKMREMQGVCPDGWHLPSDDELKKLEKKLGMIQSEVDREGARGKTEGGKLKDTGTDLWDSPNKGATNETGFTGVPGGFRNPSGSGNIDFNHIHSAGYIWSSTTSPVDQTSAFRRSLYFADPRIHRDTAPKSMGISVRCIKN